MQDNGIEPGRAEAARSSTPSLSSRTADAQQLAVLTTTEPSAYLTCTALLQAFARAREVLRAVKLAPVDRH